MLLLPTAMRIGWTISGWNTLVEQSGYILDLREEAPATAVRVATEGCV